VKECWQTASTTSLDSHSENSFSRPMRGIQVRRSSPIRRAISRDSRALGASRSGLLRLVVMQAARLIVLGGALGLVAAFAASKLLASLQVGVTSPDAVSFSLAWALMTAVAVVASEPRGCTPSSRWRWAGLTPKLSDSFDCCSVFGLRRRESAWFWCNRQRETVRS
jgi:hypothetical protein